jgi:tripartite-type tricarboxylate transporter receptor subunit TctC
MTRIIRFNRLATASAAALCGLLFAAPILAQQAWPAKPLRFLVPAPGGSSIDIVMRIIADHLKDRLGQPIIVDNKPAAGGTVAANEVARAAADGYTFFVGFNGPLANAPSLYSKLPYDPLKDLVPVALTGTQPNLLAVGASVAAGNLKEFLALAKSQPGKLNYASVGNGSSSHLSMELLKKQAGVDLTHVPFNGGPPAMLAVVSGEVQVLFSAPANLMPQVKAGKLRAIAVSSAKRFGPMPDIPTLAESGLPGFEALAWNGVMAPAGTATQIVGQLNKEINAILALPEVKRKLFDAYIEPGGGSSEAFGQLIRSESVKWGEIIRLTGAKVD